MKFFYTNIRHFIILNTFNTLHSLHSFPLLVQTRRIVSVVSTSLRSESKVCNKNDKEIFSSACNKSLEICVLLSHHIQRISRNIIPFSTQPPSDISCQSSLDRTSLCCATCISCTDSRRTGILPAKFWLQLGRRAQLHLILRRWKSFFRHLLSAFTTSRASSASLSNRRPQKISKPSSISTLL